MKTNNLIIGITLVLGLFLTINSVRAQNNLSFAKEIDTLYTLSEKFTLNHAWINIGWVLDDADFVLNGLGKQIFNCKHYLSKNGKIIFSELYFENKWYATYIYESRKSYPTYDKEIHQKDFAYTLDNTTVL